jgi:superfamily II DNA or RNA helicase
MITMSNTIYQLTIFLKFFCLYEKVVTKKGRVFHKVPRYSLGNFNLIGKSLKCVFPNIPIEIKWNNFAKNNDGDAVRLNESQEDTVMRTIQMLRKHNGGTLVAETGEGKTTMAINLITRLGLKTLILCHKDLLIDQWREELLHLTNLKKKDIGILQRGKFKDGKVVIGSQRSLMNDTFDKSINDLFSLVVQDETHLIGAEMFLKSFSRFNPIYRLGLSATPNREDGLESIYRLHLGGDYVRHTSVRTVPLRYFSREYVRHKNWGWHPEYIPMKTRLINDITTDDDRDKFVLELLEFSFALGRKKIIIFSERIKHLKNLMSRAKELFPRKKILRFFGEETATRKVKKWCPTVKKNFKFKNVTILGFNRDKTIIKYKEGGEEKEALIEDIAYSDTHILRPYIAKRFVTRTVKLDSYEDPNYDALVNADIIFATFTKAKDGINIPPLDTCIYATPFGSSTTLEQSAGRIKRKYEGKDYGLIIDIHDSGNDVSNGLYWKRARIYRFLGISYEKIT